MNFSKMVRLSCILFTVLTFLVLRTAVAQAASSQHSAVGNVALSSTSAHAGMNLPVNAAGATFAGINQRFAEQSQQNTWTSADGPNTALPNEALVGVAKVSSKDVWAVGDSLKNATSPYQTLTEHWNGSSWSVVTSPNVGTSDNQLYRVASFATNDVWAVGFYRQSSTSPWQTLTEHWNGKSWSVVTSPNPGKSDNYLIGVAVISSSDVWTVGEYHTSSTSAYQTLAEHWNGSSWSVVASPNSGKSYNSLWVVAAISSNDVWAVGSYQKTSKSPNQTLTEHWNGTKWSAVTSSNIGTSSNYLYGVIAISTSDVWAVGYAYMSPTSYAQTLAEHWNGSSWSVVTSPNTGKYSNFFEGVVAISSKDVWSSGGYYTSGASNAAEQTLAEHWNGTAWSIVSTPNFGGASTVNSLLGLAAIATNDVWSVGYNQTSTSNFQAFTEHWNGTKWSIIPPG